MKEFRVSKPGISEDAASFMACLGTILELPEGDIPDPRDGEDSGEDVNVLAWLGSLEVGLVPIPDPKSFVWPVPWLARVPRRGGEAPLGGDVRT